MKKIISILLLVLYTTSSFGITINVHYCAGKYSGLTLTNFGGDVKCSCGKHDSTHKGCCSDKPVCHKTNSHKIVQPYYVSPNFSDFTVPAYFTIVAEPYPQTVSLNSHYFSSGFIRSHSTSFLTFICIYRI